MNPPDPDRFRSLPALTVAKFLEMEAGEVVKLGLLEYVQTPDPDFSPGVVFEVEYEHDRVEFRSPGQKDAVAFGRGKLESQPNWEPCRILFSQYHRTATMRGMVLEGQVKKLGMTSADYHAMREIFKGPRGLKPENPVMSDDRFKDAGQFEPQKAWSRIKTADFIRSSEAKHPMRFRNYLIVGLGALAFIAIPLIVVSFFF